MLRILMALLSPIAVSTAETRDLQAALHAHDPWRLAATRSAPERDMAGDDQPGALRLCLLRRRGAACEPALRTKLDQSSPTRLYAEPHELDAVQVVWPQGRCPAPLLLVVTSSLRSMDGGHLILTQALRFQGESFRRVYAETTGSNNDQETRYIGKGRLRGALVRVEPTENKPYGFWVSVYGPGTDCAYRQVLRYRSATRYGDGNPLSVIDSDWPEMMRRLHLWRSGAPPLPSGLACARPHLRGHELWCN